MPDRRPPQITGRRVSAVHQGGVGAPNEVTTFRVHDAVVDFGELSVWRNEKIMARLVQDLQLVKIAAREFWKVPQTKSKKSGA